MTESNDLKPEFQEDQPRTGLSLRAKIILGNLIIVLVAVAAMGYFVFARSQAANEFLGEQFDISVYREVENRLNVVASNEVNDISVFFHKVAALVIQCFGNNVQTSFFPDSGQYL